MGVRVPPLLELVLLRRWRSCRGRGRAWFWGEEGLSFPSGVSDAVGDVVMCGTGNQISLVWGGGGG